MAKHIYGFVCDEALQKWDKNALLVSNIDQGAGVATQNVIEYFNQICVITDNRTSRFTSYLPNSETMYGKLGFIIDNQPPNNEGSIVTEEGSSAIPGDVIDVNNITHEEFEKMFNVLEDCLYARSTNAGDLIATFLNTRFAVSSTYTGYINGSIKISSDGQNVESLVSGISGRSSHNTAISADKLTIPQWIEFGFRTEYYGDIIFKLWIGREHFLTNYPLTTITDVVLPCAARQLKYPSTLGTVTGNTTQGTPLQTLIDSSIFINTTYKGNFSNKESSGVFTFSTPYMPSTYNNISISFAIVYKGPEPSLKLAKKAVRNTLLSSNIPEEEWLIVFPGLFTSAKFYIIPYWGNVFTSAGIEYECGVSKWTDAYNKFKAVFPYYNQTEFDAKLEIVLNDATDLLMAIISDPENDANKTIKRIHPTYIPVDGVTDSSLWNVQTEKTKVFNQYLSYAIAAANNGLTNITNHDGQLEYVTVNCGLDDREIKRKFVYFSKDNCDYYILDKAEWSNL